MPIFGAVSDAAVRFLIEQARVVCVRAQEFFFHEGDQASGMFVLESGRVAIMREWQGQQLCLHRLGRGDCFGEMALMDLLPRSASVQALDDCSAIEITAEHLYELSRQDLEQFALIQMNMGREVSRRLRDADEQLFRCQMAADRTAGQLFRST